MGATEDAARGRAARPGGTDCISPNPPGCWSSAAAGPSRRRLGSWEKSGRAALRRKPPSP